jgi:hypothetical protein
MDPKVPVTLGEVIQSTFTFLHLVHIILETGIPAHERTPHILLTVIFVTMKLSEQFKPNRLV